MGSNPNTVQAFVRYKSLAIGYEVKHDCLPSIHTRVLTEPQAPRRGNYFSGGIFMATLRIPTRSLFMSFTGASGKMDSKRLMLCSFAVKVREACRTRRFWFLNRNFHVFCALDGLCVAARTLIPYPHRVVKPKCRIYREKNWTWSTARKRLWGSWKASGGSGMRMSPAWTFLNACRLHAESSPSCW